jgi:hypothetical protein
MADFMFLLFCEDNIQRGLDSKELEERAQKGDVDAQFTLGIFTIFDPN